MQKVLGFGNKFEMLIKQQKTTVEWATRYMNLRLGSKFQARIHLRGIQI